MTTTVPRPKAIRLHHQAASHHSYPIRAALEYRLMAKDWISGAGAGWTIYFSSRRVLIECETSLPIDRRIKLSIEWPVRLENNVCLKLHITGRTVSGVGAVTEIEILAFEFRTCALPTPKGQSHHRTLRHRHPSEGCTTTTLIVEGSSVARSLKVLAAAVACFPT